MVVGDKPGKTPGAETQLAATGMHVELELELESGSERLSLDLVPDEQADFARGFLGTDTPLAQAILGHPAGSRVGYRAGDVRAVRLLAIFPSHTQPGEDVAARRQAVLRQAVEASDRTNAMIFASSFSGKWGDYDPTGFTPPDFNEATQEPEE